MVERVCAVALLLFSCAVLAQPEQKAAFLLRFLSFVEWPQEALRGGAPMAIGVAGAEDVARELEKVVAGRNITIQTVNDSTAGLHLVFLGKGQAARLREIVRVAPAQPLLVVCDWEGALDSGAVVNFVGGEGRVRFEVALAAAERRNLRISPRMLSVAESVKP
jgi:hypothetical protein